VVFSRVPSYYKSVGVHSNQSHPPSNSKSTQHRRYLGNADLKVLEEEEGGGGVEAHAWAWVCIGA